MAGRILAIDVGDVRMGLAVSDELGLTAQGLDVWKRAAWEKDIVRFRTLVREKEIERVVVGLPRSLNGALGPQAEKVLAYVKRLQEGLALPVELVDERLTTRAAHVALSEGKAGRRQRKETVDRMAATLILQTYLESKRARDRADNTQA